jgi:ATP phosphoribosyltransferase
MLRIAVPNKGSLADTTSDMLHEAGYTGRRDPKDLHVIDPQNDVEFFYLRPKDIATYVGSGDLQLGVTGADLKEESGSQVQSLLELGFGASKFRYAALDDGEIKTVVDLEGKRIATSYPRLVRAHRARARVRAEIVKLDGAVEISVHLGLADAVADVVSSGRTLRQHGLIVVGDPIAESEATLIEREPRPDREQTAEVAAMKRVFTERLRGVVLARQYLMMEYDCPKTVKDAAVKITPGLQAPTISPLDDDKWVAVRSMVKRSKANKVMDQLAALGAKAILTTDIRSCRALKTNGSD